MQALVTKPSLRTAVVATLPIPEPGPNEIRVKVHAIALNPVDPLYVAHPPSPEEGRVVGSDIAGTVDKLGSGVDAWKLGERVAGLLQGATTGNEAARPGGFAEYAILEADLTFRIPEKVSFEEAATFPLCSLTAAQALFIRLQLPAPFPGPFHHALPNHARKPALLIYSASTSLGLFAVQLAKLITPPLTVIATASPANHALLRALGADAVFDYRSPTWAADVRAATADGLGIDYALDCISEDATTGQISQCFVGGEAEKRIAVIRKVAWDASLVREDVSPLYGAAWTGLGHAIVYNGAPVPADAAHRAFTVAFFRYLSASALVFPVRGNPVRLMPGGLRAIVGDGFALIGSGKVADREKQAARSEEHMKKISAEKLVYRIGQDL
ncbi:GroES-like protein [Athelia psychrophila]|uniref:GroES-like protein n=1 Tax=Athelia psychrophila TaxID=1759441 RepID=A0A166WVJ4_9AGAM|nr:GroES-like protein [Fibularhizoctonia sp. CBS 109695]